MSFRMRTARFFGIFLALACVFALPAAAAEPADDEAPGIPAYAITRLKVLAGTVYAKTPDTDWREATTNTPLKPNSRVSVPEGSEAELQFHAGQYVLLTSGTDIEIPEMSQEKTRFRLRAGEIRFDLPGDDFAPVTVRIPGGARAHFNEPGRYWLFVTDEDTTRLVVRRGRATVSQEGETARVEEGQEATIGRTISVAQYKGAKETVQEPVPITAQERDAGVPPSVTYELRDYGEWVYTPSYGYVWRPRVATDWSPYVYGRWEWISPYGWTWISYEPWGWYPYHAGYWVTAPGFGWVWTPYGAWISVGFTWGWGGYYNYYHHYGYGYYNNFYYRPCNARFIPEGSGNIRWAPMRPGERYRAPEVRPNDRRLTSWNRPLDSGRVFVSQRGAPASGARQWRDVTEVRAERQRAVVERASVDRAHRSDTRQVRPEMTRPAPSGASRGVPSTTAPKGTDRSSVERRSTGGARPGSNVQDATPRSTTPRDAATPRDPTAAPRSTAPRTPSSAPPASPSHQSAPVYERSTVPPASPSHPSTPSRDRSAVPPSQSHERPAPVVREAPTVREAPSAVDRGIGVMERGGVVERGGGGGGFDRGGGGGFDRGGGFGGFESRGGGRGR